MCAPDQPEIVNIGWPTTVSTKRIVETLEKVVLLTNTRVSPLPPPPYPFFRGAVQAMGRIAIKRQEDPATAARHLPLHALALSPAEQLLVPSSDKVARALCLCWEAVRRTSNDAALTTRAPPPPKPNAFSTLVGKFVAWKQHFDSRQEDERQRVADLKSGTDDVNPDELLSPAEVHQGECIFPLPTDMPTFFPSPLSTGLPQRDRAASRPKPRSLQPTCHRDPQQAALRHTPSPARPLDRLESGRQTRGYFRRHELPHPSLSLSLSPKPPSYGNFSG